ncbi:hypothetical protein [Chitinophaga sp.]|uniref:hypothetical protein n=1 Tax=Chitinophaga sp. TaxID=1869181 RepID=UPI0031E2FBF9
MTYKVRNLLQDVVNSVHKTVDYTYIGAVKPAPGSGRFVMSIFKNSQQTYFYQEVKDGIINGFKEIDIDREQIITVERGITVKVGQDAIYTFIKSERVDRPDEEDNPEMEIGMNVVLLFFGKKEEVVSYLAQYVDDENLNIYTRLEISNFFELYGKSAALQQRLKPDYNINIFEQKLSNKISSSESKLDANEFWGEVMDRFKKLNSLNGCIAFSDLIFLGKGGTFFQDVKVTLNNLFNKEIFLDGKYKKAVSDFISNSFNRKHITEDDVTKNNSLFQWMLRSEYVEMSVLSVWKVDESLLDVGADMEKLSLMEVNGIGEVIHDDERPDSEYEYLGKASPESWKIDEVMENIIKKYSNYDRKEADFVE